VERVIAPDTTWGSIVAERWIERLVADPGLVMCLPTGNTPKPIYSAMAQAVAEDRVSFAQSTIFILDEFGGLPPGDAGRCDVMLQRDLLDLVDIPERQVHKLDPDDENVAMTLSAYRAMVLETGIDLAMVGIGLNGHIGLNEPGSDPDSTTRRVDLRQETIEAAAGYGSAVGSTWGLTLGLSELLGSKEVWLLVSGAHKALILRDALEGPVGSRVPASYLRLHDNATSWVDGSAAAMLGW